MLAEFQRWDSRETLGFPQLQSQCLGGHSTALEDTASSAWLLTGTASCNLHGHLEFRAIHVLQLRNQRLGGGGAALLSLPGSCLLKNLVGLWYQELSVAPTHTCQARAPLELYPSPIFMDFGGWDLPPEPRLTWTHSLPTSASQVLGRSMCV